jgi:hypothetical protein
MEGSHPSKVQGKKNTSRQNPKKKQKQTINKNLGQDPMQRGVMTTK